MKKMPQDQRREPDVTEAVSSGSRSCALRIFAQNDEMVAWQMLQDETRQRRRTCRLLQQVPIRPVPPLFNSDVNGLAQHGTGGSLLPPPCYHTSGYSYYRTKRGQTRAKKRNPQE